MKKYFALLISFFLPVATWAAGVCSNGADATGLLAGTSNKSNFTNIICYVIGIIDLLKPILFALAFIFFFWGLSKYVIGADNKTLKQGKEYMMWGILAIFILLSYMAIIGIAAGELDFGSPTTTGALLPQ